MSTEIPILVTEQLDQLPKEVKENVVFLQDNMKGTEITTFNPLVTKILELEDLEKDLKLIAPKEEGDYDKANIQTFVDFGKEVKSYRASIRKTAKMLRDPRLAENKAINSLRDYFIDKATLLLDSAEKEFKPYVDYKEEQKALKKAEKEKKMQEAITSANQEASDQKEKSDRLIAYNEIQNDKINAIQTKVSNALLNSNENHLTSLKKEIEEIDFKSLSQNVSNQHLLSEEDLKKLQDLLFNVKKNSVALIDDKLETYKLKARTTSSDFTTHSAAPEVSPQKEDLPPPPPASNEEKIDLEKMTDDQLFSLFKEQLNNMGVLLKNRIESQENTSLKLVKMNVLIENINNEL